MPSSSFAPGEVVTEEELTPHAREWIAGYKVPKTIEFRSEPLPLRHRPRQSRRSRY